LGVSRKRRVLDETFLRGLHRRMFSRVWRWASDYRTADRNIGIAPYRIQSELRQIIDDVQYWIDRGSYPPDEVAVRFHHRLAFVHPFLNGNGRWSRLAADLLITQQGGSRFSWGRANLQTAGDIRRAYTDALHSADGRLGAANRLRAAMSLSEQATTLMALA
jgi:Fic-DOC domain mobile mystery protein B